MKAGSPLFAPFARLLRRDDAETVRSSPFFDAGWYLKNNPDALESGEDPAEHYLRHGLEPLRDPGPDFTGAEYLALNQDVRDAGLNPLVHFERHGRAERRPTSFLHVRAEPYPEGAVETEREFRASPRLKRRTAVFAAHSAAARIPETTLLYLRALGEVADDIVFVASNPVLPGEIQKLDGLVRFAVFRDHRGYDFLSYRIGTEIAEKHGLLDAAATDELVLANDSCYAPVFPLGGCFAAMRGRRCDFWGMTSYTGFTGREHVQSYFLAFRRPVLDDGSLARFMEGAEPGSGRWETVRRHEAGLTAALAEAGHSWDVFVPRRFAAKVRTTPTKKPLALMSKFGMPLLKASAVRGDMKDGLEDVMRFVRRRNPALAAAIPPPPPPPDPGLVRRLRLEFPASLPAKAAAIRQRRAEGGPPVRALFLVASPPEFPARPLFEKALRDPGFDARLLVIPDLRLPARDSEEAFRACRAGLAEAFPDARFIDVRPDAAGDWPDAIGDFGAEVVHYPSPRGFSDFRYNPRWAFGREFLPVCGGGEDSGFFA